MKLIKVVQKADALPDMVRDGSVFSTKEGVEIEVKGIEIVNFSATTPTVFVAYAYETPEGRKGHERVGLANFIKNVRS